MHAEPRSYKWDYITDVYLICLLEGGPICQMDLCQFISICERSGQLPTSSFVIKEIVNCSLCSLTVKWTILHLLFLFSKVVRFSGR
jgi:hypothetical protein